ncbi:helix-turn-helix domain-containing protein [Rhodococcus phenolicus]|uniref:helix-turn-helix domain-containing protein n=1 Tax=Rhodococcus phenolicus TaxID=263849 RepID=UPI0012E8660E|nr:helix-turn-helix domain-containing protein [Rhodococcus phenolicus]
MARQTPGPAVRYALPAPAVEQLGEAVLIRGEALPYVLRAVAGLNREILLGFGRELPPVAVDLDAALSAARTAAQTRQAAVATAGRIDGHPPVPAEDYEPGLIDAAEAASVLGRSRRTVYRLAATLDGRRIAGRWVFPRSAVDAYAAAR